MVLFVTKRKNAQEDTELNAQYEDQSVHANRILGIHEWPRLTDTRPSLRRE